MPTRAGKHVEKHALLLQRGYTGTGPGALRGRGYRGPPVGRHPTHECATVLDESRLSALPSVARPVRRPEPRAQTAPSGPEISACLTRHVAGLKRKTRFCLAILVRSARYPPRGWISDGWHASRWRSGVMPTPPPTHTSASPAWQRSAHRGGSDHAPALHLTERCGRCDRMNGRHAHTRNLGSGARAFLHQYEKV